MLVAIEIDKKWKWIATDKNGDQCLYTHKPFIPEINQWYWCGNGEYMRVGTNKEAVKDWKNSLRRLEEIEMVD